MVLGLAQVLVEQFAPSNIKSICYIVLVVLHLVMRDIIKIVHCIAHNREIGTVERLVGGVAEIIGVHVDPGDSLPL
jgi:hypothetical protein